MTEDAGLGREFHRLEARPDAAMGAIHNHADTVHLAHDGAPEIGKSLVLIVTATACVVVEIVGDLIASCRALPALMRSVCGKTIGTACGYP